MDKKKYKYHKISVYCELPEMERWKRLAKKHGSQLSDWIREVILEKERAPNINSTNEIVPDSPAVAELIIENQQLKERIEELSSFKIKDEIIDETKIISCLSKDWKTAMQIAEEAKLFDPSLHIIARSTTDKNKQSEIVDILFKAEAEVLCILNPLYFKDVIESKKTKGGLLWRMK